MTKLPPMKNRPHAGAAEIQEPGSSIGNPLRRVLSRLSDHRQSGSGWKARCPAHDDRKPSLSIGVGDDGRVLLNCKAGCSIEAVVAALGLTKAGLFPNSLPKANGKARKPKARIVESYPYVDEHGELIFEVVRKSDKSFPQRRPDGHGGWTWNLRGIEKRPLYRLPELLNAGADAKVFVPEGEKDADRLRSEGLVATTTAGGAGKWKLTDLSPLHGRPVVLLPDKDDAGHAHMRGLADELHGKAASVKLLELDGLAEKGDVSDWLEAGHSVEELHGLVERTPVHEPQADEAEASSPPPGPEPYHHFPVKALPEPVRGFVASTAKAMGCDSSFVALPLLSALASAIGNTRRIRLKRTWDEPPILWTAIVGESGTLKSPAMEAALAPVREADRKAGKAYEQAMEQYEREQLAYDCDLKQWKNQRTKKGGGDAGEPPEPPEKPTMVRHDVEDTTAEALAPILMDNWRGVLLARDELAGWLESFNQYKSGKGGDVAAWLNFHGGRSAKVDRKTGQPRTIRIPRAAVCVTGGIQPGTLRRALGFERFQDGLAARLLLAMPPTPTKQWTEAEGDAQAERRVGEIFARLYALEPRRDEEGGPQPVRTPLSEEGKQAWIGFYDQHNADMAELDGDLRAAWAKLEGYAARLALLIHFIRWAGDDPTLADPAAVDERSMAAGVTLCRWFGSEARRVYAMLGESDEDAGRRKLVELVERKGGRITPRALMRCSRQYATADEAEKALDKLADAGLGKWEIVSTVTNKRREFVLSRSVDTVDADTFAKNPPAQANLSTVNASTPPEQNHRHLATDI